MEWNLSCSRKPQQLKKHPKCTSLHVTQSVWMEKYTKRCKKNKSWRAWMKESTVILTSLYSQIYSPSHRQKERVEERKKESTTMSVSVNLRKEKLHWYNGSLSRTCSKRHEYKFRLRRTALPVSAESLNVASVETNSSICPNRDELNKPGSVRSTHSNTSIMWACTWKFDGSGWNTQDNAKGIIGVEVQCVRTGRIL